LLSTLTARLPEFSLLFHLSSRFLFDTPAPLVRTRASRRHTLTRATAGAAAAASHGGRVCITFRPTRVAVAARGFARHRGRRRRTHATASLCLHARSSKRAPHHNDGFHNSCSREYTNDTVASEGVAFVPAIAPAAEVLQQKLGFTACWEGR
jgi:hypothetical protein